MADSVRVNINHTEMEKMLTGRGGPVHSFMTSQSARVFVAAHGTVPRRTGVLADSLDVGESSVPGKGITMTVSSDRMRAWWTERGTRRIRPVTGRYLRIRTATGRAVYKESVKGQRAQHWLWRSLQVLKGDFIVKREFPAPPGRGFRP